MRRIFAVVCLACAALAAQTGFEAASIKPDPKCQPGTGRGLISPGRIELPCVTPRSLIRTAYSAFVGGSLAARATEVTGGPAWLDTERYAISAKAAGPAAMPEMLGPMLQALLVERFRVAVHKEAKDTAVYALSVARGGHKLRASTPESCVPAPAATGPELPKPGQYYCGFGQMRGSPAGTSAEWRGVTLAEFAGRMLSNQVDRPVVDQTGVAGRFDIRLDYSPQPRGGPILLNGMPAPPPPEVEGASPSIFTALQEQLGLKLSPARAPLDVIVVDRAERPSEN